MPIHAKAYWVLLKDEVRINSKSLLGVVALGLHDGMILDISADGPDEAAAIEVLASHLAE